MPSKHSSARVALLVLAALMAGSSQVSAVTQAEVARTHRVHLRQLHKEIKRSRFARVVASVRPGPVRDTAFAIVIVNHRWNNLTRAQRLAAARTWWERWAAMRARYEKQVVVDIKAPGGYPLLHCYGDAQGNFKAT